MAILIEDGSGVANAVSYATAAEAQTYADARGLALPTDALDIEKALVTAGDYLLKYESNYQGARSGSVQRMSFPRYPVYLYGSLVAADAIPESLKEAQIILAIDVAQGTELNPNGDGQETLMEKVGPITVQYAERGSSSVSPVFNKALDLLKPLFSSGGGANVTVVRA